MTNSAHNDITLTVPEEDIDTYSNLLNQMKQGQPGDALKIVNLIAAITRAVNKGDANFERHIVKLTHNEQNISLTFNIDVLQKKGWIEDFEEAELKYCSEFEFKAICSAVEDKQFGLSFDRPEYSGKPLKELYELMDLFTIGRPSTLSNILTALEEDQLLEVDEDNNEVKITDKGLKTYSAISNNRPDVATPAFCVELTTLQDQIANGDITMKDAMRKILPMITAEKSASLLAGQMWEDITDLYTPSLSKLSQALISKVER